MNEECWIVNDHVRLYCVKDRLTRIVLDHLECVFVNDRVKLYYDNGRLTRTLVDDFDITYEGPMSVERMVKMKYGDGRVALFRGDRCQELMTELHLPDGRVLYFETKERKARNECVRVMGSLDIVCFFAICWFLVITIGFQVAFARGLCVAIIGA